MSYFYFLEDNIIPEGTNLFFLDFCMQRDPKYFENPDKFDPYRFMKDTSNKNAFNYIPFSAGPRNCIGKKKNSYNNCNQYYQHIHT